MDDTCPDESSAIQPSVVENRSRFEPRIDRSGTSSEKWEKYAGLDVLPFWVADMDLPTAPFVIDAARERLEHPILGYTATPPPAVDAFLGWLARRYDWLVDEDWLVWIPGVVPGLNFAALACSARAGALGRTGADVVVPAPVYPPFLKVPQQRELQGVISPLVRERGQWRMDFDALRDQISERTAAVLFCNPQNPTGRVYEPAELRQLAELIVGNDTIVVSDEIHCPLVLDPAKRHVPIASLDAAVAARSISLFAPTKAYNFPGLGCAVAVVPDADLRERFATASAGLATSLSPLAYAAATAAFNDTSTWLDDQNAFLADNAVRFLAAVDDLEGIEATPVEGTYLAWLDVSALRLDDPAATFEAHGLGLSDGKDFGAPGFLRFNFGCPRSMLEEGIARLQQVSASV